MRSVVEEIKTITDGKKSYKQFNTEYSGKLKVLSNRGFNGRSISDKSFGQYQEKNKEPISLFYYR